MIGKKIIGGLIAAIILGFCVLGYVCVSTLETERRELAAAHFIGQEESLRHVMHGINDIIHEMVQAEERGESTRLGREVIRLRLMMLPQGQIVVDSGGSGQEGKKWRDGVATISAQRKSLLRYETPFTPHWQGEDLVFLRQIPSPEGSVFRALWVDWAKLREHLSQFVADQGYLHAEFVRMRKEPSFDGARREPLLTIPLMFYPYGKKGAGEYSSDNELSWTYAQATLQTPLSCIWLVLWVVAFLSAGGLVLLVYKILILNWRRAAFVSAVTHELRTPLTTFALYTEMLEEGLVSEGKKPHYYRLLRQQSQRLMRLVENAFAYAKLERNPVKRLSQEICCEELLGIIAAQIEFRLRGENVQWTCVYSQDRSGGKSGGGCYVFYDEVLLAQIWDNLLDNFLKYVLSPEGGVPLLSVEMYCEKGLCFIEVRDNGAGIAPSVKKSLFEPFTRSAEAAAGHVPGVGLGLSLAREAARTMGGDLILSSTGDDGTVFTCSFICVNK